MGSVRRRLADPSGQATVLFALLTTVLMGSAAIVVDVGRIYVLKAQEHNAMVAAALAGAAELPGNPTQALSTAQTIGTANGFPDATYAIACGGACVVASASEQEPSLFAQFLGHPYTTVASEAAAARGPEAVTQYTTPAPGTATAANGYVFFSAVPSGFNTVAGWTGVLAPSNGGSGSGSGTGGQGGTTGSSGTGSGGSSVSGSGSTTTSTSGSSSGETGGSDSGSSSGSSGSSSGSSSSASSRSGSSSGSASGMSGQSGGETTTTGMTGTFAAFQYNPYDVGQAALLPFDVTVNTVTSTPLGEPITLKVGAGEATDGNFGPLSLAPFAAPPVAGEAVPQCSPQSNGASVYEENIVYGACQTVHIGDVLSTETGDMVGPTVHALETRFANYTNGDPQLAVVPVVQAEGEGEHGKSEVTVEGFAAVLLEDYTPENGPDMGEVTAEFIGAFLPGGTNHIPSLMTGVFGATPYLLPPGTDVGPLLGEIGGTASSSDT